MRTDDVNLIHRLRNGRKQTLQFIYEQFFPLISDHVIRNSGSVEDAKDVFQDTIMAVFQNISDEDFALTCQFKTYLYAVGKRIWLKRLRDVPVYEKSDLDYQGISPDEIEEAVLKVERYRFYSHKFSQLSQKCQELLTMFLNGIEMKSIARHFGFASISYTKKRKFQCKERLFNLIESDPEYKILTTYD